MGVSSGQGSLSFSPKQAQSGPPFAAGAANNGLSVDPVSGLIVLGQDVFAAVGPAQLLNDRVIPVDAFTMSYVDPVGNIFFHNAEQLEFQHFDGPEIHVDGQGFITITGNDTLYPKTPFILLQDDSLGGSTVWLLRNLAGVFSIEDNNTAERLLALDYTNLQATIGDIDASVNGTKFFIDDGNTFFNAETAAGSLLQLNQLAGAYVIGDVADIANGAKLFIDDANQRIQALIGGNSLLSIDAVADLYFLGNTLKLTLDNALSEATIKEGSDRYLQLDVASGEYKIGDIDGALNSSRVEIDDTNAEINILATNGFRTSDPGFATGNGLWLLGDVVVAASVLDGTKYLEAQVEGVMYKLALAA